MKHYVGFWYEGENSKLPDPHDYVMPGGLKNEIKKIVIEYLTRDKFKGPSYRGMSTCRICGEMNGSCDMSDGEYVWPQGYAHYIDEHDVMPPYQLLIKIITIYRSKELIKMNLNSFDQE